MAEALKRLPPEELPAAAWDFAAGPGVAAKTRVIQCESGLLAIEVPDATWRAQLKAMAPQFLARLNLYIPVKQIEFRIASEPPSKKQAKGSA